MSILRKIEEKFLNTNPRIPSKIRPLSTVSVVYKTSSNESRVCQGAIVISVKRLSIKVAIVNANDLTATMVRTFFLHSPLIESVTITKSPKRKNVKSKQYYILNKNTSQIRRLVNR